MVDQGSIQQFHKSTCSMPGHRQKCIYVLFAISWSKHFIQNLRKIQNADHNDFVTTIGGGVQGESGKE